MEKLARLFNAIIFENKSQAKTLLHGKIFQFSTATGLCNHLKTQTDVHNTLWSHSIGKEQFIEALLTRIIM